MKKLLKDGVQPGLGLEAERHAVITGLVSQAQLNGKEVMLLEFIEETERWLVTPVDSKDAEPMNIKPANLIYSRLIKEAEKAEKKEQQEAVRKQQAKEKN